MSKEKVFIIVSHVNSAKQGSHPGRKENPILEWEISESVEFVNQIRNKHISTASAIGDYINKKMITGSRYGINDYDQFEEYIRTKYKKQMDELDSVYHAHRVVPEESEPVFVDAFGNVRAKTVFDPA